MERVLAFAGVAVFIAWMAWSLPYGRVVDDTKAKLERAAKAEAEINARRAQHYAHIIASCLSGNGITDGERIVDCVERR